MKKTIILLAVIICVLAVSVFLVKNGMKNHLLDGPGMEYVPAVAELTYDCGTDEYGHTTVWHLQDWRLTYDHNGGTVEDAVTAQCDVANDFYLALETILEKYQVKSWTGLAASDFELLDGAKTTVTIAFADGAVVRLGDDYQMPQDGWSAVSEIVALFEDRIRSADSAARTEKAQLTVGEDVRADEFREFYYTYAATSYPPEFQRYRFYTENGHYMFYHETREGERVFLTEEDITVQGTRELTAAEWDTFWNFLCRGSVQRRSEDDASGSAGPWLYLYLNGELEDYQEFYFAKAGTLLAFEEFCLSLK